MTVSDVEAELEGLFSDIEAELEGLLAQTEKISDSFKGWGETFDGWYDESAKFASDAWAGASAAADRTGEYFDKMYSHLTQLEDVEAIANQIGELTIDEVASAFEGLSLTQVEAE